jgi:SPOR domain
MAERYQDRPFPGQVRGGDPQGSGRGEGDPLAELARLIGQTDPFGNTGRGNPQAAPRTAPPRNQYQPPEGLDDPLGGPRPPWIQRANRQEVPRELQRELPREALRVAPIEASREVPSEVMRETQRQVPPKAEAENYSAAAHPLNRYGAQHPEPAQDHQDYQQEPPFDEAEGEPDPSRYDEALYGQIGTGVQGYQREQAYPDDPFGYQDDYEEEEEEQSGRRGGGLKTVAAVLVLAVLGTGAALGYRAYFGSTRNGEPPIIRADNSPTKVVPPTDGSTKVPDRLGSNDGSEKIVPREEAPVDINTRSVGPRVVFPPLNQNGNPPSPASVSPNTMSATSGAPVVVPGSGTGTLANNEPRRVKTLSVRGDQPDGTAAPTSAAPPPASPKSAAAAKPPRNPPSSANASANGPLSLSPQGADSAAAPAAPAPRARVAATTSPVQAEPDSGGAASSGSSGGYMVQVSSQPSEGVAQASYKSLQTKFSSILGGHDAVIQRADLADKRVVYRAMVGPFSSREEALQLCTTLKTAGGQCFVPRN